MTAGRKPHAECTRGAAERMCRIAGGTIRTRFYTVV
jgi:hypothetical protein